MASPTLKSIQRTDTQAIEKWIEKQLNGTSVTVVLIGAETYDREWVKHEIKRSYELGKGMLGIFIHSVKDPQNRTDAKGKNPFDHWSIKKNGRDVPFSELYKTYDWIRDDGNSNFPSWIEAAAVAARR